ncbi:Uncharacterised protein [Bacteroides xylanisolvens]|nr:Uncharacterised protein [Bacteroides xylanisolvens]
MLFCSCFHIRKHFVADGVNQIWEVTYAGRRFEAVNLASIIKGCNYIGCLVTFFFCSCCQAIDEIYNRLVFHIHCGADPVNVFARKVYVVIKFL